LFFNAKMHYVNIHFSIKMSINLFLHPDRPYYNCIEDKYETFQRAYEKNMKQGVDT